MLSVAMCLPARGYAQGTINLELPAFSPFPAAPDIRVHAVGFGPTTPVSVRLRLAVSPTFGLLVYDSTIAGPDARFLTRRLLPENRDIYAEASVLSATGVVLALQTVKAGRTGNRLTLLSPVGRTSVIIGSRQPQFVWSSAAVSIPPGPWIYELFITNVARQETRSRLNILDTVFTIPDSLQANTSYRWQVVARLANGFKDDSAVVSSESSFIIAPSDAPVATLLYQNFPNPFPAASSSTTCLWFDLQVASHVELSILDIRGNRVKTIIPGQVSADLPSGRYGRLGVDRSGCDPRLAWDGTSDNGRTVPPGVYLVRLKTGTSPESVKKILFLGR